MKIDKVILSTTNNPLYYDFWNPLSKVLKEKFSIEPILVWLGEKEEYDKTTLNEKYGKVYFVKPNPNYPISMQSTWVTYWITKYFPNDICFIQGIDEVPLSKMFLFEMIEKYDEGDYVMLIADAYLPNYWSSKDSASPSGQHCAKGSTFHKIYKFEDVFGDEIEKIFKTGISHFWKDCPDYWGMDESYFSLKLREFEDKSIIQSLHNFQLMVERRIECERHKEPSYDLEKLKQGWYSQAHLCRPFSNHVEWLTKLYDEIPKYV